jgi:diguanylate cyclase (GGDEF)-like protein
MGRLANAPIALVLALLALLALDVVTGMHIPVALWPIWRWRGETIELGTALICALHGVRVRRERLSWLLIAVAIVSTAVGGILTELATTPSYPSVADGFYLAFYPLLYAGLALLVRARGGGFPVNVWLDGGLAAAGVSAIAAAIAFPVVLEDTGGARLTVVTNLAYPVADVVLLGLIVCVIAMMGWRPGRAWLLLIVAVLVWSAGDLAFLYQIADGTYVHDSYVDLCYPASLTLIALAARQDPRRVEARRSSRWLTLVVPGAFGSVSIGLVLYDHFSTVDTTAVLLAGVTLALVVARLVLTFLEHMRLLDDSRREAFTDPLTGLGNRRALSEDLDRILLDPDRRSALILFDLDGFKGFNDTFGHPAGDALLQRLAARLRAADHGGTVYRMGGDEFCVLAPVGSHDPQDVARLSALALAERGDVYEITSSYGVAILPDESEGLIGAMRLADKLLYLHKGAGRRSQTGQAIDTLVRAMNARGNGLEVHGSVVAELAGGLAASCGLPGAECEQIRHAAILHDLGKLAMSDAILQKPGPLDEAEWKVMRRHPEIGQRILGDSIALAPVGVLVRSSHENHDGSGYPDGLAGDQIPLGSRIVALCDAYHAMVETRAYRDGMSHEEAVAELHRCAGTQFDPALIEPFLDLLERRATLEQVQLAA